MVFPVIAHLDFGYPWWLSYGHLVITAIAAAFLLLGYFLKWSRRVMILWSIPALWSVSSFLVVQFAINVNARGSLPTANFLRQGSGRVLDLGAGTGRSAIMVLEARPKATVVALDLFSHSFEQHFGHGDTPQQRLQANLKEAGVDQRATIVTSDMRKLPFEPASFDAIISSYAIDHLNRDGINETLAEASRVLKPGGEFLMMVVAKDFWVQYTFGPLLIHSRNRGPEWWSDRVKEAGFQIVEEGTPPATVYVLAKK
jgi:ubiquinone/menaquinone biosynthesis C-methylase UbiE